MIRYSRVDRPHGSAYVEQPPQIVHHITWWAENFQSPAHQVEEEVIIPPSRETIALPMSPVADNSSAGDRRSRGITAFNCTRLRVRRPFEQGLPNLIGRIELDFEV